MSNIIDGNLIADKINQKTKQKVGDLTSRSITPTLAVILVGEDPASKLYVDIKEKKAKEVGIMTINKQLPESITSFELISEIKKLNNFKDVNAILLQLPLPKSLNLLEILDSISPKKDVDALNPCNLGKLLLDKPFVTPPTAAAIMSILEFHKINLSGKNIVLVGYGKLVGKPLAAMISLSNKNATLTVCNHKTKNLKKYTKDADILISATGAGKLITKDMVRNDSIIIDAGVSKINGKICGDTDFENIKDNCRLITPSKGGVGPVTVAKLLENVAYLTDYQHDTKTNIKN